ncbi:hypothetical protein HY490_03290 [Candidatus Woesearchaeota archaeon]|nr:hypothetical protein [Candidatus Woesearchaeota archaeon]
MEGYLNNTTYVAAHQGTGQRIFHYEDGLVCIASREDSSARVTSGFEQLDRLLPPGDMITTARQGKVSLKTALRGRRVRTAGELEAADRELAIFESRVSRLRQRVENPFSIPFREGNYQFGFMLENRVAVLYGPDTEFEHRALIPREYYGNWLAPLSKRKNRENLKYYNAVVDALRAKDDVEEMVRGYVRYGSR